MLHVHHCSEASAKKLIPHPRTAVISITSPGRIDLPEFSDNFGAVLRLQFHDFDGKTTRYDVPSEKLVPFDEGMAQQIIDFVNALKAKKIDTLVVHCHAGISRSAAIAKFAAEINESYFPPFYRLYNVLVYNTLWKVYHKDT